MEENNPNIRRRKRSQIDEEGKFKMDDKELGKRSKFKKGPTEGKEIKKTLK